LPPDHPAGQVAERILVLVWKQKGFVLTGTEGLRLLGNEMREAALPSYWDNFCAYEEAPFRLVQGHPVDRDNDGSNFNLDIG